MNQQAATADARAQLGGLRDAGGAASTCVSSTCETTRTFAVPAA